MSFCVVELLSTPMCALPIMQSSNLFSMLFKALVCLDPGSGKSEAKSPRLYNVWLFLTSRISCLKKTRLRLRKISWTLKWQSLERFVNNLSNRMYLQESIASTSFFELFVITSPLLCWFFWQEFNCMFWNAIGTEPIYCCILCRALY